MKGVQFVSVSAVLLFGSVCLAADSSGSASGTKVANAGSSQTQKAKTRPFTPEDLKRGEANKKKVEWWQMPKPAPIQSHSSRGGGHGGH